MLQPRSQIRRIQGFWTPSRTAVDPEIPYLPLESSESTTGTGTLIAQDSVLVSTGLSSTDSTAAVLSSASSAVAGSGTVTDAEISGTGVCVSLDSTMVGIGESSSAGAGATASQSVSVAGEGLSEFIGNGVCEALASTCLGEGLVTSLGIGALGVVLAAVAGIGIAGLALTYPLYRNRVNRASVILAHRQRRRHRR